MAKLTVDQVDLAGKRVFLRVDFNVPLDGARVTDDTRIRAALPTIHRCLERRGLGACSPLISDGPRASPIRSTRSSPVAARLAELLGRPVPLAPDCVGPEVEARARALQPGEVVLLENLRFHAGGGAQRPGVRPRPGRTGGRLRRRRVRGRPRAHASIEAITGYLKPGRGRPAHGSGNSRRSAASSSGPSVRSGRVAGRSQGFGQAGPRRAPARPASRGS